MIAALLMAAAPPPPRTDKPVGLISATDYPQRAIDKEEEGPVAFKALVAPDGTVDKCTIMVSSHYRDLDDATCTLVKGRARFAPAKDASGNPMYGVYKAVITWSLGNVISGGLDPELELKINQSPAGVKLPIVMTMSYWTRADGTADNCKLDERSAAAPPVLAELACQSILAQPAEVITNSHGQPVGASNSMTVRFSLDH